MPGQGNKVSGMKKIIGQLLMHYISYMSTLKEKVDKTDGLDGAGYLSPNNSDTCGHLSGRGITNTTKQKRKKIRNCNFKSTKQTVTLHINRKFWNEIIT